MADEKDKLGDTLRNAEKAREDQWARDEDRRLIEKLRSTMAEEKQAGALLKCPQCAKPLAASAHGGVAMMACPGGHGAWLDAGALKGILSSGK